MIVGTIQIIYVASASLGQRNFKKKKEKEKKEPIPRYLIWVS